MKNYSLVEKAILFCAAGCFAAGLFAISGVKRAKKLASFQTQVLSTINKPAAFVFGAIHLQLAPRTSVRVTESGSSLKFSDMMGTFEFNILPGAKVRFDSGAQGFDLASVDGGRIFAEALSGGVQVQNVGGDILVISEGRALRVAKRAFVTLTDGHLNVASMAMPVVVNPRIDQRYFTGIPNGEVRIDFMPLRYRSAKIEYNVSDTTKTVVYRGELEDGSLKLNLAPGQYRIFARVKRGHEYSAWTEPRQFSVWSRPAGIATAF